jgi:hypothetical protein
VVLLLVVIGKPIEKGQSALASAYIRVAIRPMLVVELVMGVSLGVFFLLFSHFVGEGGCVVD